jgi:hypothetical protein
MGKMLHGMVVGVSGLKIRQEYSFAQSQKPLPLGVISIEFQCMCLSFKSPAIRMGKQTPKQADRSKLMKSWHDDRQTTPGFSRVY